jgi:hypothetical protein
MLGVLDDRAIEHLLQSEVVARIACYADEKLYVVPVTYVYTHVDGSGALMRHSADGQGMR